MNALIAKSATMSGSVTTWSSCPPLPRSIGRGAVLAIGAIVTKNIHSYSIVAGVSAKVISKWFSDANIEKTEASRWWKLSSEALKNVADEN